MSIIRHWVAFYSLQVSSSFTLLFEAKLLDFAISKLSDTLVRIPFSTGVLDKVTQLCFRILDPDVHDSVVAS